MKTNKFKKFAYSILLDKESINEYLIYDKESINEYLIYIYKTFLKRKPDKTGFNSYLKFFESSGVNGFKMVLEHLLESDEYKQKNQSILDKEIIYDFLEFIYSYFLKRKPDKTGFNSYLKFFELSGINGFKKVLENILEADEYKSRPFDLNLEKNKEFDFNKLDINFISSLFEKTAFFWRNYASEPTNIYWSVLTSNEFKKELNIDERLFFLDTGKKEIDRIKRICHFIDYDFDCCKNFLDFGCGVGRLVVNLPSSIKKVNCVDFSLSHLKEAETNLKKSSKIKDYSFYFIESFFELKKLPDKQDIIHSFIVLQHNTPPVIEKTIEILLNLLSKNGIAILHIPITIADYKFDPYEYLENSNSGKTMELHILPKSNIYKLAKNNNCKIIYSLCEGGVNGETYSEIIVFQKN